MSTDALRVDAMDNATDTMLGNAMVTTPLREISHAAPSDAARPRVSIVVPSWSGQIDKLRASIADQTFQDYELIVVAGVSPAGRARAVGVQRARGDIIVFIDDDATFGHAGVLGMLIATLDSDERIGIVGPSKIVAPDATWLQRRIAHEVPRWVYPILQTDTESSPPLDRYGFTGITTTCCATRRSTLEAVGGFDTTLTTGEDPEFFYRVGLADYRFVIPADCWVYHNPPAMLRELLRKSFRYGDGHAQEATKNPERQMDVVPLRQWYGLPLVVLAPLLFLPLLFVHIYFDPVRHLRFGFLPLKTLSSYATLYGYTFGWYRHRRAGPSAAAPQTIDEGAPAPVAKANASASRSSTASGLTFLGVAVLNNIYAIVMARLLPVHAFGILGLTQSWLLIAATLLNSGFPWELARALAQGASLAEAYRSAKSALAGNLAIWAICGGLLVTATLSGALQFDADGHLLVGLLLAETLLLAFAAVGSGIFQGRFRFGTLGISRVIEAAIKLAGGIALVLLGWSVLGALVAMTIGTLISVVVLAWGARDFRFWRERTWGGWGSYRSSLTMFAGLCALTIISNSDIIGIKLFSAPQQADAQAGYYQAAAVLARIPLLLAGTYATALFPYIARAEHGKLKSYSVLALKYALLLVVPLNVILIAEPTAAIRLIFPASYSASADALRIAASATLLLSLTTLFATILQARGFAHLPARWLPLMALLEVALLWWLTPIYGIVGAALSLLVASSVACALLAIACAHHFPWLLQLGTKQVVGYLAACIVLAAVLLAMPGVGLAQTIIGALLALGAYGATLALFGLVRPEDITTLTAGLPLGRIPFGTLVQRLGVSAVAWLNRLTQ